MTTVPSMARELSARRIASTAAWSAAFSSPRPMRREAASAAASVTRTTSSARLRSIFGGVVSAMGISLVLVPKLELLDSNHTRLLQHRGKPSDGGERSPHRRLLGVVSREHDGDRLARSPATL